MSTSDKPPMCDVGDQHVGSASTFSPDVGWLDTNNRVLPFLLPATAAIGIPGHSSIFNGLVQ